MSIWINEGTRILVQGVTGKAARFHTQRMLEYGSNVVAGATPGKQGQTVAGLPVYDFVQDALKDHPADASVIFVPASAARDAILESIEAEIRLIVCITEHIPIRDMLEVQAMLKGSRSRLIGPNCPGIITPGSCKIGIMPGSIHRRGSVGVVSRSGTLTYEAVAALTNACMGQSTAVGIGGDPIQGTGFIDVLSAFNDDPDTGSVILIGEIGGDAEEAAAEWIRTYFRKPIAAFIAGASAPPGKRMGHAGAIISGHSGTAESKIRALETAGVPVARRLSDLVPLVQAAQSSPSFSENKTSV